MRRTNKQIEASRANGKKSAGPVTPEGKSRSAQNAIRHGLSSRVVVLDSEDKEEFNRLLAAYMDYWKPANEIERDLVEDIAGARWRLHRTLALEAATIDLRVDEQREAIDEKYSKIDEAARCSVAVGNLVENGSALAHYSRHEARLRRTIRQATAELRQLQAERPSPVPVAPDPAPKPKRTNEPGDVQPTHPHKLTVMPVRSDAPPGAGANRQDAPPDDIH